MTTDIKVLASIVTSIQNIIDELEMYDSLKINIDSLQEDFKNIRTTFGSLKKFTNQGKGSQFLRVIKLKELKKWLAEYSKSPLKGVETDIPKRLQGQEFAIDTALLDKYRRYSELAIEYMTSLPSKYKEVAGKVVSAMNKQKEIEKLSKIFEIKQSELPAVDELRDDDGAELEEEIDIDSLKLLSPKKTVKKIQGILSRYGKFVSKTEEMLNLLDEMTSRIEETDTEALFMQVHERNELIKRLFRNLVLMNKSLYQADFETVSLMREKYIELVNSSTRFLPERMAKLVAQHIKPISRFEQLVNSRSEGFDPAKDEDTFFTSPHIPSPPPYLPLNEDKEYELPEELMPKPLELPGKTPEGTSISEEEKKKYEALWEEASLSPTVLSKLADQLLIAGQK